MTNMNVIFLCNKKKDCNGSLTCGEGFCRYTYDIEYAKNPDSVLIAAKFMDRFDMNVINGQLRFEEKEKENE